MKSICIELDEDCGGIENDPQFDTQFIYGELEIGDKTKKAMYLKSGDAIQCGARLVTPFFPMKNRKHGVLMIKYFMNGEGITSLAVVKQDSINAIVWKSDQKSSDWQKARISVEGSGDPRFFIEVICEPGIDGTVAVSKVKLQYCDCINCEANNL